MIGARTSGVAIAEAVKASIGNRLGTNQYTQEEGQQNHADPPKGRQTRDIVADKAGFGSHKSYESANRVVDKGIPELVGLRECP